jgi:hypothetical protein
MSFIEGQYVWSPLFDSGYVTNVKNSIFVKVYNGGEFVFDLDGRYKNSSRPLLFHQKIPYLLWPNPEPVQNLKLDDMIFVSNTGNDYSWQKAHFSHYKYGQLFAFTGGKTSFTSNGCSELWLYWKRP